MIRKNLRPGKRNYRWLTFLMLFGILIPYLKTAVISFPKKVSAEPVSEEKIFKNSAVEVTANHVLQNDKMLWTISYNQAANALASSTKFKILDDNQNLAVENLADESKAKFTQTDRQAWLSSIDSSSEEVINSIQFAVNADAHVQLYIQVERVDEQGQKSFVLSEKESGPYQLIATTQSATTSSSLSSSNSEVLKNTTSSTSNSLAGVSGTANSSTVNTKKVPVRAGDPTGQVDASQILLSEDAVSTQMNISVSGGGYSNDDYEIVKKNDDAKVADINNAWEAKYSDPNHWEDAINKGFHYRNFNATEIAVGLNYGENDFDKILGGENNPVQITVSYDDVGFYQTKDENGHTVKRKLAAVATVSNIIIGKLPTWASENGKKESTKAFILFSRNMFSGVYYAEIAKMDINFVFKDVTTGEIINFPGDGKSVFSFNSLNGYHDAYEEFAGVLADNPKAGTLGDDPLIDYHPDGFGDKTYTKNTYFGTTDNVPNFKDSLGDPTFTRASVTFDLHGVSNSFKFGSTDGRAWTSFSSSAVFPVQQTDPIKTVQTLKTNGNDSGFENRLDNNLDIYPDGMEEDFLTDEDRRNFPEVNKRIIERGDIDPDDPNVLDDDFYYFINQPTINLATQGLILPTTMTINDNLPNGITLADGADGSFTLYDQEGREVQNAFTDQSHRRNDMSLTLSQDATNHINQLSTQRNLYGKDFVIRIKVKPTNDAINIQDSKRGIMNQASSVFTYDNNDPFTSTTNEVNVKFKKNTFIKIIKEDRKTKRPLAGATFSLRDVDSGDIVGTESSSNDGLITFVVPFKLDKEYRLHEDSAPEGYATAADEIIKITNANDPTFTPPVNNDCDQHYIIYDDPANVQFKIKKIDSASKIPIAGVTFELSDQIKDGELVNPQTEITGDDGVVAKWVDEKHLLQNDKTYYLKEKFAPTGYLDLEGYFEIKVDSDNQATVNCIGDDSNVNQNITTETDNVSSPHTISFTVENERVPTELPKTGGRGIRGFILTGLNLNLISLGYLILRKKRGT